MARKIRFRQQRLYNLRIAIVLVIFVAVLFSGLIVIDLNKSYVMYGEPRFEIIQIEKTDTDVYKIDFLNRNFTLNLKYIMRDINKIKSTFLSKE